MITKTPSRVRSLTSSACRVCPERMILAALPARFSAGSSTVESWASPRKKKSATPRTRSMAPIAKAMNSVRRHLIGKFLSSPQRVAPHARSRSHLLLFTFCYQGIVLSGTFSRVLPVFPKEPAPLAGSHYPRHIGPLSSRKRPANPLLLLGRLSGSGRRRRRASRSPRRPRRACPIPTMAFVLNTSWLPAPERSVPLVPVASTQEALDRHADRPHGFLLSPGQTRQRAEAMRGPGPRRLPCYCARSPFHSTLRPSQ